MNGRGGEKPKWGGRGSTRRGLSSAVRVHKRESSIRVPGHTFPVRGWGANAIRWEGAWWLSGSCRRRRPPEDSGAGVTAPPSRQCSLAFWDDDFPPPAPTRSRVHMSSLYEMTENSLLRSCWWTAVLVVFKIAWLGRIKCSQPSIVLFRFPKRSKKC